MTPAGSPLNEREIAAEKPFSAAALIDTVCDEPAFTETAAGPTLKLKSGVEGGGWVPPPPEEDPQPASRASARPARQSPIRRRK